MSRPAASENPANDTDIIRNEPAVRLSLGLVTVASGLFPVASVGIILRRVVEAAAQQLLQGIVHFGVAGLGQLSAAAEALRVIEVLGGGEQIGVCPDCVTGVDALPRAQRAPQCGGVT